MNTQHPATGGLFQRVGNVVVRFPLIVIALWIAVAAGLTLTIPPLSQANQQTELLPPDAPGNVTSREMAAAFHEKGTENIVLVLLTDENGLSAADEQTYSTLVGKLRADKQNVESVGDFLSTPPLREILTSADKKAWNLPVTLTGQFASPEAIKAYKSVADTVKQTVKGTTLTANLTGPGATVADLSDISYRDLHVVEIVTATMVLLILLIVYRNPVTMALPLITIGVSLVTAQAAIAGLVAMGLGISAQTMVFMTAIMFGAGTDYAVFLLSRYHDYMRMGQDSDQAIKSALASIGKVLAASAATVAVTFLSMIFTRMLVFNSVGPALAVSVVVAFVANVTFLPAVMTLVGRRGWIKPRRDLTSRFWWRSGVRIVRKPKAHLAASLIVLIVLASASALLKYNWDERKTLPQSVESAKGYVAVERHFPLNTTIPQYLFIKSPNDLRTPEALADLEEMARRVTQVPGVALVRGITRPTGESLEQAKLSYQAGEVGGRLQDASSQISGRSDDLDRLTNGADKVADSLGTINGQVSTTIATVRGLVEALDYLENQFGGTKTLDQLGNAGKLVESMQSLGAALGMNLTDATHNFDWIDPVAQSLQNSPICNADASCTQISDQLQRLQAARDDGTLSKIEDLARQLQATQAGQTLDATVNGLRKSLDSAAKALQSLGLDNPAGMRSRLLEVQKGASTLADASRQVADGVQSLVEQTRKLGNGLGDASAILLAMKSDATTDTMAGFYIPAQILTQDDFKKAAQAFISPDGHAVRYLVQTNLDLFSTEGMDQVNAIEDAARSARPNTKLEGSSISMAGIAVGRRDSRDYYFADMRYIFVATILVVLLILIILLRAIVAPVYLILSVLISYLAALGISVIFFQFILGQGMGSTVPGLTFILLVAVGADYNLLLISRIREESQHGVRLGVIRTVRSTGGVITSAGLIFAASMGGLLFASVTIMVQVGFVIGVGILLDTFLVRTLTVPALAAALGEANWWPNFFRRKSAVAPNSAPPPVELVE